MAARTKAPGAVSLDVAELERLARAALLEITPESTVGERVGEPEVADGVATVRFASTQSGYPDWFWTVALGVAPGDTPTVLETELMPGEGSLLAPDWVPWAVRLEEYRAAQAAAGEPDETSGLGDGDDADDVDDDDLEPDDDLDDLDEHDLHPDDDRPDPSAGSAPDASASAVDSAAVVPPGEGQQDESAREAGDDDPERRRVRRRPGRRAQG